jgi:hypothetical protein
LEGKNNWGHVALGAMAHVTIVNINKDGNPSTKITRHVKTNVNTWEENQNNQNNSNEVEYQMLKGHSLPQIA